MVMGSSVIGALGASPGAGTFVSVPPPTGVAATDTANIAAALAAVATAGGTVQLQAGNYAVSSSARVDTGVTYHSTTSGNYPANSWADASITAADVGKYVIGGALGTNPGIQSRTPKILTVNTTFNYFTTDIQPNGTVSSAAIRVVQPGFVLPEGVTLNGCGGFTTSNGFGSGQGYVTRISDAGSGITCLVRGNTGPNSAVWSSTYGLSNISFWGYGYSALYGLYVDNGAWFIHSNGCDFSYYTVAGVALDGNINSHLFENSLFLGNGTTGATSYTGGVITHPFYSTSSAAATFINCFWDGNNGAGLIDGGGAGAFGVAVLNSQFNNTSANAASNDCQYGPSAVIGGNNNGGCLFQGNWSESAAANTAGTSGGYDLIVYGTATASNCTFGTGSYNSGTHQGVLNHINLGMSVYFEAATCTFTGISTGIAAVNINYSGCAFLYQNCQLNDTGGAYFYSSCGFSNANAPISGSSRPLGQLAAWTIPVTSNAGTAQGQPGWYSTYNFTNSSAATMTITLSTSNVQDGQTVVIRIYDFSGSTETITWVNTENSGVSAATTSNGSTTLPKTVTFMFNGATSKWRCIQSV
jgi:hypothetical protein